MALAAAQWTSSATFAASTWQSGRAGLKSVAVEYADPTTRFPNSSARAATSAAIRAREGRMRYHGAARSRMSGQKQANNPESEWRLELRFYIDPETEQPHIWCHGVTEEEVADVLRASVEDRAGREGSRVALGQTASGRYLRVVYVPDVPPISAFVITAYELGPKARKALRRRRRRRR